LAQAHGKDLIFAVCFSLRRTAKGVTRRLAPVPLVAFFAVRHEKTHGKDYLPRVVRRGARQRRYYAKCYRALFVVRSLSYAPMKNARQRLCHAFYGLCRALVAHGKAAVSRCDQFHNIIYV
jgi:hypothetical protein